MNVAELSSIEADLRLYLREKTALTSPEFSAVAADVIEFTSAVVQSGFREALANMPHAAEGLEGRSFIELADAVVEHHLRLVSTPDREIVRKSLLEAYFHAAGPRYVFEPPSKTHFVRSLRRWGTKDFVALLLSLYVFNSIGMAIQDEVKVKMPDVRSFEIYMLGLESICRDAVKAAVQATGLREPNQYWIREVTRHLEEHLLHAPSTA